MEEELRSLQKALKKVFLPFERTAEAFISKMDMALISKNCTIEDLESAVNAIKNEKNACKAANRKYNRKSASHRHNKAMERIRLQCNVKPQTTRVTQPQPPYPSEERVRAELRGVLNNKDPRKASAKHTAQTALGRYVVKRLPSKRRRLVNEKDLLIVVAFFHRSFIDFPPSPY